VTLPFAEAKRLADVCGQTPRVGLTLNKARKHWVISIGQEVGR
jgi:hypothetical protein